MFGQDTNFSARVNPPAPGEQMVNDQLQTNAMQFAHHVSRSLNNDATISAIKRLFKTLKADISPQIYTLSNTFATANVNALISQVVDGAYHFICTGWAAVATTPDFFVTQLKYASGRDIFVNNFPGTLLTRWTGKPVDLSWIVPANTTFQLNLLNGATAVNVINVTFFGFRVPAGFENLR